VSEHSKDFLKILLILFEIYFLKKSQSIEGIITW